VTPPAGDGWRNRSSAEDRSMHSPNLPILLLLALCFHCAAACAQSDTSFTYQGQLLHAG
jgi:hypothetical protein